MPYLGDVSLGQIIRFSFGTNDANGAPITLAGTPTVACYKGTDLTEFATGLALSVDHDSLTGVHLLSIDTGAGSGDYVINEEFNVVLTAGTVDGVTVAPTPLCHFSIRNRLDYATLHKLNTLFSVAFNPADAVDDSLVAKLISDSSPADAADFNNTLHSLTAIVNNTATVPDLLSDGNPLSTNSGALTKAITFPDVAAALTNQAGQDANFYSALVDRKGVSGNDNYYITLLRNNQLIDADNVEITGGGAGTPTLFVQRADSDGSILLNDVTTVRSGPSATGDSFYYVESTNTMPLGVVGRALVKCRLDGVDQTIPAQVP